MTVGENLSYNDERIIKGSPQELENMSFGELTVVYINRVFGFRGSFATTKA